MTVVHKPHFLKHKLDYFHFIDKARAFIYPTDTIYGIGCDATNTKAVQHVRALKHREKKPFSIIVPNKQWILQNCVVDTHAKKWLKKLPGKYTLILHLKNKKAVSRFVHLGDYTIGVRIPNHWFAKFVKTYGKPIVTTSVNISGQPFMTGLHDVHETIKKKVAFILYEGIKKAHPSTIVDLTIEKEKIKKR
ncbi:MAG: L-threonylcarbamoyladenylate synthase [Candidatus Woesearchaeota archaeon]|jgi:L-threonylcarbamoyladenylate synthase